MEPVAVYVHVPFCPSKCGYCDFNSYAMSGAIVDRTVEAIATEIRTSPDVGRPAKTVFFGGGTPTLLSPSQLERLLAAVFQAHPPVSGCEVTSEANPGTVDSQKFGAMRSMGFNRISIGAQSFDTGDLLRLGRIHEPSHVGRAIGLARKAGFDNVNLDLMFALPGQSVSGWRRNLRLALSLEPEHLSLYCLTIEPNTRFYRLNLKGMLDLPDDEAQVAMYDLACEACEKAGLNQYEISNFSRQGRECQHNLCYWRAEEYLGYGPGAVGRVGSLRQTKIKHPERYCRAVEQGLDLACEREELDDAAIRLETVMLGVRLNEGLPLDTEVDSTGLHKVMGMGWLESSRGRLRLTPAGRHFCSEVAVALA